MGKKICKVKYFLCISDLSDVDISSFKPSPVIEGSETTARCTLLDGYPEHITDAKWKDENDIEIDTGISALAKFNRM